MLPVPMEDYPQKHGQATRATFLKKMDSLSSSSQQLPVALQLTVGFLRAGTGIPGLLLTGQVLSLVTPGFNLKKNLFHKLQRQCMLGVENSNTLDEYRKEG